MTADSQVEFGYAAADPQSIRPREATCTHHWRNPMGWLREQAMSLALVLGVVGLAVWVGRRWGI